eukprot:m.479638 g.479638  ORF g.479638 m.479638 type:complete len:500 (+) comp21542_c0_seq1:279-1778(+)
MAKIVDPKLTPVKDIPAIVQGLRQSFNSGRTRPAEWRVKQLNAAKKLLQTERETLGEALYNDLHMDSLLQASEIDIPCKEADNMLANLKSRMAPESRSVPVLQFPGHGKVHKDPLGVVLIIAPWNYPVSMVMRPLMGALAAGNCVVLKPSEVSAHTNNVLGELIAKYMDPNAVAVVQGGVAETTALLKEKFDKIMYTGNGAVGKIVMRAAAEHLTPVLLELGGKSPCIIDENVDLNVAAPRIAWAKYSNAGQTCIAPDYVLVHSSRREEFLDKFKSAVTKFYSDDPKTSKDFGSVINARHVQRIQNLIETSKGKVVLGGKADSDAHFVEPTVIVDPDLESPVMKDEIFGPVLPVITIDSIDEAIEFVNKRDKPLALYIFSKNKPVAERVFQQTSSGGAGFNECLMHSICPDMPFGGVGPSGTGHYNGPYSFEAFSHQKAVLYKPLATDPSLRFPPYTDQKMKWLLFLNKVTGTHVKVLLAGLAATAVAIGVGVYAQMQG